MTHEPDARLTERSGRNDGSQDDVGREHAGKCDRVPSADGTRDQETRPSEITRLLRAYGGGDPRALNELLPLVYNMLRRVARRQLRDERDDHTLATTDLVHEAFLDLSNRSEVQFADRAHFFAAASRTMRHVLIDYAVRRNAQKRGGGRQRVSIDDVNLRSDRTTDDLIALDHALARLEKVDERLVQVVECRFFAGLTIGETAEALEISDATVSRDWTRARAWLNRELKETRP